MKRKLVPLLVASLFLSAGVASAASITLYQDDNYRGRNINVDKPIQNFDRTGFNDRARSAVVHEGQWEICVDADYGGSCSVLAPGAYPELGAYSARISSMRPVDGRTANIRPNSRNQEARATLFEGPNLSGRAYALNGSMENFGRTGFNDRASSLRVESGYWIFCSDAEFRGECRTFGPGDYASLAGLNNMISSGRSISSEYPYSDKPDWQRSNRQSSNSYQVRPQ